MRAMFVCVIGVIALAAATMSQAACASDKETVQAAQPADASIGIETGQLFVTVENRSGGPLIDLTLTVLTPSAPYTYMISRIEAGQKRDVAVNSFSSRDGTGLNLRLIRPRNVKATAKDLTNKPYAAQVAWK